VLRGPEPCGLLSRRTDFRVGSLRAGTALDLSLMNPPPPTEAAFFHATDMEVDVDDSLIMDHEAPMEKTDTDFFNGPPHLAGVEPPLPFTVSVALVVC
jgi:hypothetical protein